MVRCHHYSSPFVFDIYIFFRFNRKLSRDEAKTLTINDILKKIENKAWGNKEEYAKDWQEWVACWNEIYRLIHIEDQKLTCEFLDE